jgi:hypothetical protein
MKKRDFETAKKELGYFRFAVKEMFEGQGKAIYCEAISLNKLLPDTYITIYRDGHLYISRGNDSEFVASLKKFTIKANDIQDLEGFFRCSYDCSKLNNHKVVNKIALWCSPSLLCSESSFSEGFISEALKDSASSCCPEEDIACMERVSSASYDENVDIYLSGAIEDQAEYFSTFHNETTYFSDDL